MVRMIVISWWILSKLCTQLPVPTTYSVVLIKFVMDMCKIKMLQKCCISREPEFIFNIYGILLIFCKSMEHFLYFYLPCNVHGGLWIIKCGDGRCQLTSSATWPTITTTSSTCARVNRKWIRSFCSRLETFVSYHHLIAFYITVVMLCCRLISQKIKVHSVLCAS